MLNWVTFCVLTAWSTYINKSSIISMLFMWSFLPQGCWFTEGKDYGFHLTFSKESVHQCMLTLSANEARVWSAGRSPHTEEQKSWQRSTMLTGSPLPLASHVRSAPASIPGGELLFPLLTELNVAGPELNCFSPEILYVLPEMILLLVSP